MAGIDGLIARPPAFDYRTLADPLEGYMQGREANRQMQLQDSFAQGLPRGPDGQIDFNKMLDTLAKHSGGKPELVTGLGKMALDLRNQQVSEQAAREFSAAFGGGQPQPAAPTAPVARPAMPPAAPPTGTPRLPAAAASGDPTSTFSPREIAQANPDIYPPGDTLPLPRPRPAAAGPATPPPITWGDGSVGEPGSLPPPGAARPSPAPAAAPGPLPGPVQSKNPAQDIPFLISAASNPRLPQMQRDMAKVMLEHALKSSDLPPDQKDYALARAQGETDSYTAWLRKNKQAGATAITVDQRGENEFEKEFGKKQADRWNGYIAGAQTAERKLVDIQAMRGISKTLDDPNPGVRAGIKETLGPYAAAVGVNISDLPEIQAYSSIIQRLAPQQRVPGSGATSDIEYKGMLKSMPGLMLNPQAREVILDTMEAIERTAIAEGEIATRLATKEITRQQAERDLRNLGDPMKRFSEWRKANPQLYGQSLKAETAAPGAPSVDDLVKKYSK